MPRTPSAFPFSGRLRRRAINPTPPKRVKAWGEGPLRPEVMYPVVEHTRPNRAARNHSRSRAPHHRTQKNATQDKSRGRARYLSVPPTRHVQRGQKCSSPTRRLPSRSWGPIQPRVCSWFRAPIRHECQTAQLKSRGRARYLSLPPTRHDLTQGQKPEGQLKWGYRGGEVGNEPRLEPCLSVLLIGSLSAM